MTDAETLLDSTEISARFSAEIQDVSETCKRQHAMLTDENIPEEDRERLEFLLEHSGIHAYRYEVMPDGSVIALWANDSTGEVKFKTFNDMEQASLWSPREERVEA